MYQPTHSREQRELLPPSLEERIAQENPVRVIDAFADTLDLCAMGFTKARPAATGRPAYDPRALLKLYLYGHINGLRSSRRLMRECARNIEVMWLINRYTPDFRTISDFRKENRHAIVGAFQAFVTILREERLLGWEMTVDGTKIRANNSIKKSFTPEVTAAKLAYLREQIAKLEAYLNDMDTYDKKEETLHLDVPREKMPAKIAEMKARVAKYNEYQKRFAQGEAQILATDPECRTLYSKDGLHPAYNIQTATETKNHFIVGFTTTNANTDQNQLSPMGRKLKRELKRGSVHLIADKGYESRADIESCLQNGIVPDVGFKYDKDERVFSLDYVESEITPALKASCKAEDIQTCLHAGVLPDCYEGTNISVETQELSQLSCFIRHEDGSVTCPMGKPLFKHTDKKYGTVYGSREACRTCKNRCTDSKDGKTVCIGYESSVVPVLMYGSGSFDVQSLPEGYVVSPNNHSLNRKGRAEKRVILTVKRDVQRQQLRKEVAEHPFGTIKWYDGAYHFLCRGTEKVSAEIALSFLGYDLRRACSLTTPKRGDVPGILMLLRARKLSTLYDVGISKA